MKAWSALKFPGRRLRWFWTWMWKCFIGPQRAWTLLFLFFLRLWDVYFQIKQKPYFLSESRTLGHWTTVHFLFSLTQADLFNACFRSSPKKCGTSGLTLGSIPKLLNGLCFKIFNYCWCLCIWFFFSHFSLACIQLSK